MFAILPVIIICILVGANFKIVLGNLEHHTSKFLYWFKINSMNANPEKFQFMILSKKSYQPQTLLINTLTIDESDQVELRRLTIDKLNTNFMF